MSSIKYKISCHNLQWHSNTTYPDI